MTPDVEDQLNARYAGGDLTLAECVHLFRLHAWLTYDGLSEPVANDFVRVDLVAVEIVHRYVSLRRSEPGVPPEWVEAFFRPEASQTA